MFVAQVWGIGFGGEAAGLWCPASVIVGSRIAVVLGLVPQEAGLDC